AGFKRLKPDADPADALAREQLELVRRQAFRVRLDRRLQQIADAPIARFDDPQHLAELVDRQFARRAAADVQRVDRQTRAGARLAAQRLEIPLDRRALARERREVAIEALDGAERNVKI